MPAEATVQASVRRLPFHEIDAFPTLFQHYCARYEELADFFAGDFRQESERRDAVERAAARSLDRDAVADVLLEQNDRWGLDPKTRSHIETLRRGDSAVVVTGQQVGIFTGPLFTVLKALTTLQLAEQLAQESGRPVVPVFWLGAEDHDFGEIARVHLLRRNEPIEVRYRDQPAGNPGPVGRIRLSDEALRLIDEVDEILPPTDFKPDLMRVVRAAYEPGRTLADAFALLMRSLFSDAGLVLVNSDDARLKRIALPLLRREIADGADLARSVREVSEKLRDRYHEQVQVRPANLFLFEDEGRFALDAENSTFHVRDRERAYSREELLDLLDRSPERFSPNVVLRPLLQDFLFPTAVYVGGPSEISYFAQYRPAYEWAGLPMPLIYPRASVTMVESKVAKVLERYHLSIGDLSEDVERLFQRVVVEAMDVDLDELFTEAGRHLHEAVNDVTRGLQEVDRTLSKSAEATRSALIAEFDSLKSKALRAEKRNQNVVRDQIGKAHANVFPEGILQERALSILYFLNKYSLGLLDTLRSSLSTDTTQHQVVEL